MDLELWKKETLFLRQSCVHRRWENNQFFLRTSFVFNFFLRSAVWCSKTAAWWLPVGGSWKNYSYTWYVTAIFCVLCKALDKFLSGFARVSRTCVLATGLNHSVSGGRGGYAFLLDTQIQLTSLRCVCVLGWGGREVLCLRNFVLPYSYFFIMKMLGTSWIIRTRSLVAFDSRERSTSASPVIIFAGDLESMESGLAKTAFIFSLFLFKHIIQI